MGGLGMIAMHYSMRIPLEDVLVLENPRHLFMSSIFLE